VSGDRHGHPVSWIYELDYLGTLTFAAFGPQTGLWALGSRLWGLWAMAHGFGLLAGLV